MRKPPDDPAPGYMEMDLVLHSGGRLEGSYLQTLVLTDVATGWTECMPLLVREQNLLIRVLEEVRIRLPFTLRGLEGIVNLTVHGRVWAGSWTMERLCCVLGARLLGPDLEGQGTRGPVVPGCGPVTSRTEVAIDESVGRQEALRLQRRFEPLHLPLSPAG